MYQTRAFSRAVCRSLVAPSGSDGAAVVAFPPSLSSLAGRILADHDDLEAVEAASDRLESTPGPDKSWFEI